HEGERVVFVSFPTLSRHKAAVMRDRTVSLEFLVVPEHLPDIRTSFTNPWHLVLLHTMHSCIIGRQRKLDIPSVEIEEMTKLFGAPSNVLNRIVHVSDTQRGGCVRRQLHESHRTLL